MGKSKVTLMLAFTTGVIMTVNFRMFVVNRIAELRIKIKKAKEEGSDRKVKSLNEALVHNEHILECIRRRQIRNYH